MGRPGTLTSLAQSSTGELALGLWLRSLDTGLGRLLRRGCFGKEELACALRDVILIASRFGASERF